MPDRSTVSQVLQLGVEVTPGTAVAANRQLTGLSVTTGIDGTFDKIDASGLKLPTGHVPGKEWSTAKISGRPAYDELGYLLSSVLRFATPVQQGATTAYKQTADLASSAEDPIKSYTVEAGSAVRAHKFAYGLVTELGLKGDRDKVELTGSMIGQATSDGITLTAAPTVLPLVPILPKEVSIYADDTSGGLGTTKLTRVLSWDWKISNRFGPLWVVDAAQTSWATHVELMVSGMLKLLVEADSQGMGLLTTMRAGSKKFIRLDATSAVLAGVGFPYKLLVDMCGVVAEPPKEFKDQDGVYAVEWTFGIVHDPTWTRGIKTELTNKVVSL